MPQPGRELASDAERSALDPSLDAREADLIRLAIALGALDTQGPLTSQEWSLVRWAGNVAVDPVLVERIRQDIEAGRDPLGDALCVIRPAHERRQMGAIYTPSEIVNPMVGWILEQSTCHAVDAGCGSGRFTSAVLRGSQNLTVTAVDLDPMATILTRAAASVLGACRVRVLQGDYTRTRLSLPDCRVAFVGNPPYVRHHLLSQQTKEWAQRSAKKLGLKVSGLAGLHAYFFLATALYGRKGDIGCFVTSSEWLDVNYGAIVRQLLLETLGGQSIHVLEPTAAPFGETATTAAVTCFAVGERPAVLRLQAARTVAELQPLGSGHPVTRERLAETERWTPFIRTPRRVPSGYIELGDLCRVHRGAVTGMNSVWVVRAEHGQLPPSVLFPSVTHAKELFAAGEALNSVLGLKRVVDLPEDLDSLDYVFLPSPLMCYRTPPRSVQCATSPALRYLKMICKL